MARIVPGPDVQPIDPEAVREVLRAAFSRTRGLGLTVEEVDGALGTTAAPAAPPQEKAARAK